MPNELSGRSEVAPVVSDEFRRELIVAARARIGEGFLDNKRRPYNWMTETPFAYGLSQATGGINCSGLVIASLADVLGRRAEDAWNPQLRTSRAMVDLVSQSEDYLSGQTDFGVARTGDVIATVSRHVNERGDASQIGRHLMIVERRLAPSKSTLSVIHADPDSGVAKHSISSQYDRVRVPLGTLIGHGVIDASQQTF